ncbi:TonB-dependent receptor [Mucilaginibacter agri]|uniref:SusC/RagA family TonB-linked outer membrane protein n=1 Tax=Mucilaginibacter agri TaxID=2695265 RepID=A0A966DWM0_9SPHI|nr:TonB-dependent receptor [Mucilaginibacter agri]NCD71514.1 SusC/RagA family TonB-linked outer membrane protein [Mucilaginibacter agri]
MKITLSQILITAMVSGITYASPLKAQSVLEKTVNISLENTNLLDVLTYLQKTDNVKFIYSKNSIDVSKKVSVNFRNQPLKDVLDQVLKTNGIDYSVMKDRIVLSNVQPAAANGVTVQGAAASAVAATPVTGKITDDAGLPVIGATIVEKGTTNGVTAGVDGSFKLNVSGPNAVLVVQFLGYQSKEVVVGSQTVINVVLAADVKALNEVVVIGYGTQKKSVVTGSISHVGSKDLEDQVVTRVDQALQGRTSGVNVVQSSGSPGASPTIRIRGITSINNSNPLYVIDGVVVLNGGLDNVNPNDVESIEVLKDASAAIYGSRASAGVVLVTTKKGKSGTPQIGYSGYMGIQGPVSKVKLADASQYAALRNQSVTNDGGTAPFANPAQYGKGTNWQDEIFSNNAMIQSHNLNISGGTDKSSYYVSFGYLNQDGIVLKDVSNYKRYNFAVNTNSKLKKWLTVGENFAYTYINNQGSFNTNSEFGGPLSSSLNLDPITPVLQTNAAIAGTYNQYAVKNAAGVPYGISPYVGNEITNPLAYAQTIQGNYGWSHNMLGNAFVEIEPIKGLKVKTQINGKQAFFGSESFTPLYYLNSNNSNITNQSAYRASNRGLTWNWDNTITYAKTIGLHNFSVLAGTSAQESNEVDLNGTYNNLPVSTFDQSSFNFALPAANRVAGGGEVQPYHTSSYFGRVTYDYDERYLFTGIIRRDGSSKFGTNNVYGTFPGAEIGWVATREKFFPKDTFIDFLKFRGSYGSVGNEQSLGYFQYTSIVSSGKNYVFGPDGLAIGYSTSNPANPDLKWESVHTTDIGFDAVLFHNFNVTFDVYRKTTKGMLEQLVIPGYTGYTAQPYANVGSLENKGFELELNYKNHVGAFNYNVGGNISYNKNNVTDLGQTAYLDGASFQGSAYTLQRTQVGQPVRSFYGFNELGTFKSQAEIDAYTHNGAKIQPNAKPGDFKWQDVNGDGVINDKDRSFLGNALPTWTYGVNVSANYKAFDLKVFGQGVWGNKLFQAYRRLDLPTANYSVDALNAWTPSNNTSNYPRLTDSDPNGNLKNPSNFYLQSGAYFRIKTAQIGYTVPKEWLNKVDIKKVRIYLSSNNLATFTKYKGFDPEVGDVGGNNIFGVDRGIYPQSRSFLVGLDITL